MDDFQEVSGGFIRINVESFESWSSYVQTLKFREHCKHQGGVSEAVGAGALQLIVSSRSADYDSVVSPVARPIFIPYCV